MKIESQFSLFLYLSRWGGSTAKSIDLELKTEEANQRKQSLESGENIFKVFQKIPDEIFLDPYFDYQGAPPAFYEIEVAGMFIRKKIIFGGEEYFTKKKRFSGIYTLTKTKDIEQTIILKPDQFEVPERIKNLRRLIAQGR